VCTWWRLYQKHVVHT